MIGDISTSQGSARVRPGRIPAAGRPDLLAAAAGLAARARRGAGSLLVLGGPTGIGRSALLDAVADQAARAGMTVLRARCSADESRRDLAAARQLFGAGPDPAPAGAGRPGWAGTELWELLRLHAARQPLLLAVDDVQFADGPSADWLLQLGRRIDRLPVLLVATELHHPGLAGRPPGFGRTLPPALVHSHRIDPLALAGVAELVRARLGDRAPAPLVAECARASGGNPLLLHGVLGDLRRGEVALGDLPGDSFQQAVDLWLHAVGEPVAEGVRTLAQLALHRGARAEPVDLLGDGAGRAAAWLRAQGMLVDGPAPQSYAFTHPWLPRAALAGWGAARRGAVHQAVAAWRHDRGETDESVAEHLLEAPAAGPEWAADVLLGAAGRARRAGERHNAVRLLRRALQEPLGRSRRGQVLFELGCLEVRSGPQDVILGIRHLSEAVRLHQRDEAVFEAANALGTVLTARGETADALAVMEDLAERFAASPDLARAVHAAAALLASHDGASWRQVVEGLRRIETRTPGGLAPAALGLLTEFDSTSGRLSADEVAERVQELTAAPIDTFSRGYVLASAATLAQWADRLPEADRLVAEGMAVHRGSPLHPAYQCLLSVRAESRVMRGQYELLLTELGGPGGVLALGNSHLTSQALLGLLETDRLAEAHRLAHDATAESPAGGGDSWEWSEFLYARGLLRLASGAADEALADLLECGRRQGDRQVVSPIVTPWRSAAADCHLLLGRVGPAAELAAEELRLARIWGTPRTVGRALRVLGASTGGRHGLATVEESVRLLRDAELDTELIPALVTLGGMLRAGGRRAAARQTLREAVGRAERTGAVRQRGIAARLLVESGARPTARRHTGVQSLTAGEQRVCRLAAAGSSNAEIAELLHLARRTVETHLTNSFRKLGIRRRADLAACLERPDEAREQADAG
ncbi:LuxR C-terminal-related transcriptional regulator [Kitasatospora sp. NBC_00374]|uniref:LuxR C-terminal-related transcriptional regulator n=1 Tax=Kitasatospora sp. NBC_00374 TaxID=2975964 RepID=UPI0030E5D265